VVGRRKTFHLVREPTNHEQQREALATLAPKPEPQPDPKQRQAPREKTFKSYKTEQT